MLSASVALGLVDVPELAALARGCALLGSGGGADPAVALAASAHAVREHGAVRIVALDALAEDGLVLPCGQTGSDTVATERMWNGDEGRLLCQRVERSLGAPVAALMPFEIGGANGLLPVVWAARLGLPLVDADGMGRTFPDLHRQAMHLAGIGATPVVVTDGSSTVVVEALGDAIAARLARAIVGAMGGVAAVALYAMRGSQARAAAIPGSISRAHELGSEPLEALPVLFEGRVMEIVRRPEGASATLGSGSRRMRLELRSGYVLALEDGAVAAAVPDVICVLAAGTGEPVPAHALRPGADVTVVALPAPAVWRTERGLALAGPEAFGYHVDRVPLGG